MIETAPLSPITESGQSSTSFILRHYTNEELTTLKPFSSNSSVVSLKDTDKYGLSPDTVFCVIALLFPSRKVADLCCTDDAPSTVLTRVVAKLSVCKLFLARSAHFIKETC